MFGPIQSVRSLFGFRFVSSNVLFTPGCFGNLFVFGPVHVQHGIDKFVVIDASTVFGVVDIYYSSGSSTGKSTVKICHCMTKRRVTDGTFFVLMLRSVLAKHIQHVLASRFRVVGCNDSQPFGDVLGDGDVVDASMLDAGPTTTVLTIFTIVFIGHFHMRWYTPGIQQNAVVAVALGLKLYSLRRTNLLRSLTVADECRERMDGQCVGFAGLKMTEQIFAIFSGQLHP